MNKHSHEMIARLGYAGIVYQDAMELRRISMTLHRWHEMECGYSNQYCSYALVRGFKPKRDAMGARLDGGPNDETFVYDDNGKPYLEMHRHSESKVRYEPIADRERGALKRLKAILARYPGFETYVQTDPRGASLYILRPEDMAAIVAAGSSVDSMYTRGIAVHK